MPQDDTHVKEKAGLPAPRTPATGALGPELRSMAFPAAVCAFAVLLGPKALQEAMYGRPYFWVVVVTFPWVARVAIDRPHYFLNAGLLLVASDQFMAMQFGSLTMKPSYAAFVLASLGAFVGWVRRPSWELLRGVPKLLIASTVGLLALYAVATVGAAHLGAALKYLLVILGGAILPLLAVLLVARSKELVRQALAFFVLGQLLVAIYGLYQFAAAALGLPSPIPSNSVLLGSSLKRLSGVSFEPSYHAAYVLLGLPLLLSDAMRGVRRVHARLSPLAIAIPALVAFVLTFSRAGYLAFPLVLGGTWAIHRSSGRAPASGRKLALSILIPVVLVFGVAAAGFHLFSASESHLVNTLNPKEKTSNAPRVGVYEAVLDVIGDHPLLGVGPDQLGYVIPRYGIPVIPGAEHDHTANDIWLQGAVDAGLLAIPLLAGVLVAILLMAYRRHRLEARLLALGTAVVLIVNGTFVSFLWDMKVWAVLGLAIVAQRAPDPDEVTPLIELPPRVAGAQMSS